MQIYGPRGPPSYLDSVTTSRFTALQECCSSGLESELARIESPRAIPPVAEVVFGEPRDPPRRHGRMPRTMLHDGYRLRRARRANRTVLRSLPLRREVPYELAK